MTGRDLTRLDLRFGTQMQTVIVRRQSFIARQPIRHRETGELRIGWFFFHYGRQIGVCLVGPAVYDFKQPFGRQEDLLYRWESYG